MAIIVDSDNIVNSLTSAPDRLRAEIGRYFSTNSNQFTATPFQQGVGFSYVESGLQLSQQLIPTKKARVFISGEEHLFRDQIQWNDYVNQTIVTDRAFLDHQFQFTEPEIESAFSKNYHSPEYENLTKLFPSNQLLNWNLISYPHKDEIESVQKIGDLKARFDNDLYIIESPTELSTLIDEFQPRLTNYSGSIQEVERKQRNIFDIQRPTAIEELYEQVRPGSLYPIFPTDFPFHYTKFLSTRGLSSSRANQAFNVILTNYKKRKNIFQSIKRNSFYATRNFSINGTQISGKIHDLTRLVTTTNIVSTSEGLDELLLVEENDLDYNSFSNRFEDQVNTINFLSQMRGFIDIYSREIEDIYQATSSETFFLGYKIEKYLDNDIGNPIQTYYTNDRYFYDTQLKYGRKYIYKTKVLLGVLGSSYTYTNLVISQNETRMMDQNGATVESNPSEYIRISDKKYRAYVDVEATPSFQVLEYEIESAYDEVAFVDTPTLPPQVEFRNNSKKANIEFHFSPMFATVESVTRDTGEELIRPLRPLTDEDRRIKGLIDISKTTGVNPDYFTGIYEIYRMPHPPQKESDFMDYFLISVDDKSGLEFPENMGLRTAVLDNMNAYFEDNIIPHRKYYYAFRALTFHGTPSNLTIPLEVELLRDSDEYKINVSQYRYPTQKNYVYEKEAKRILKVVPNIERLLFDDESLDPAAKSSFTLDEGSMLIKNSQGKKFKIRVTSKHTGKKIDINLNLKLTEDTNSFTQN